MTKLDLLQGFKGSPGGSVGKELPAMQETRVWSLGLEDLLEKGMVTNSSILSWEGPCTEEPGGLQIWSHKSQAQLRDESTTPGTQVWFNIHKLINAIYWPKER